MSIDPSHISNHNSELAAVKLPISKSIANRVLLLQAIHGDPLMTVSADMPDDVRVLHDALARLEEYRRHPSTDAPQPITLYLKNCGTALRFLQVHLEKCYPGAPVTLDGDERLKERAGKPTSQLTSARILHGENIPVEANESPYITMSRRIAQMYPDVPIEADWSAAAFWYEFVAIHGGELVLEGLTDKTLQGDYEVERIYRKYFGVLTSFLDNKVRIFKSSLPLKYQRIQIDFENIPDLYPSVSFTCERLGIRLEATGTSRLRFKESNRLTAVRLHEVRNDHRMAMALMAADFPVTEEEQACVAKSYPDFVRQLRETMQRRDLAATMPRPCRDLGEHHRTITIGHITPIKGVNDDNKGKKYALSKLIHSTDTDYVWLHDDDVVWPKIAKEAFGIDPSVISAYDLVILPLRMESESDSPSLLEELQIAEYAAIQQLTMSTVKNGQAVMCSGANLIVRREVWLECEQELHPEIPSGDDMFLLEAVKRRGYKIGVIDEPDYTAVVHPQTGWHAFFRQRMRWAGKAPHYTDPDIRRCGARVVGWNVAQLICPLVLFYKFPAEYRLIKEREAFAHTTKPRTPWYVALLLEILYPIYLLISLIGGLFRRAW